MTLPNSVYPTAALSAPLAPPTELTATANGQTRIDLAWTGPSDGGGAAITGLQDRGVDQRLFLARPGRQYGRYNDQLLTYRVGVGKHPALQGFCHQLRRHRPGVDTDSATTEAAPPTKPGAPTGLSATADGQTEIDLSWSAPSDDGGAAITGYKIEVSTNGSSWSDLVANTGSITTSYSHTGLTAGSTRYYRVSAINSAGTGSASNTDSATTTEASVSDGTCTVDLIVELGESCTYPGTSTEFSVDADGTGAILFTSSGSSINLRNTTINGVTYTFVASKQSDGSWRVEEVG